MNKLDNSHQLQETQIPISKLQASILIAFERTLTEPYNIENMVKDIISEFPKVKPEDVLKAIRNGGLGKYGKTYKLSTQEVCIWIREYVKEKNKVNIGI